MEVHSYDPAALGRGLAALTGRAFGALARNAAFAALLALPATFVLHERYATAFVYVFAAAAAVDIVRAFMRRLAAAGVSAFFR
jgi:hypothetical protein